METCRPERERARMRDGVCCTCACERSVHRARAREREGEGEVASPAAASVPLTHVRGRGITRCTLYGLFLAFHLALSLFLGARAYPGLPLQRAHQGARSVDGDKVQLGPQDATRLPLPQALSQPRGEHYTQEPARCGRASTNLRKTEAQRFPPPLCVARLALNTVFMSLTIVHRALLIAAISTQSFRSDGPVFLNRFRADHHFFCPRDRCDGFLSKASTLQLSCEAGVDFGFGSK